MAALLELDDDPTDRGLTVLPDGPPPVPAPRVVDPGPSGPPAPPDAARRHVAAIAGVMGWTPLSERYGDRLDRPCPRCSSIAGLPCRDQRGNPVSHPHGPR